MLKTLAKAAGSYVVALYDCSRLRIDDIENKDPVEDDIKERITFDGTKNYIATYGSIITDEIPAKVSTSRAYMKFLKGATKKSGGYLALPGCLGFFQGTDGKCSHSNDKTS